MRLLGILMIILLGQISSAEIQNNRPEFKDYPVNQIFRGKPAPPIIVTKKSRKYRTVIQEAASSKVEFAGHYTIPTWGCGTDCEEFAIVDSISGQVYDEFWLSGFPGDWWRDHEVKDYERKTFRPNSTLLKIDGCPRDHDCGFYDYQMVDGEGLKLIRKRLLPKQYRQ